MPRHHRPRAGPALACSRNPCAAGGGRDPEARAVYNLERAHHADPQDEEERGGRKVPAGDRRPVRRGALKEARWIFVHGSTIVVLLHGFCMESRLLMIDAWGRGGKGGKGWGIRPLSTPGKGELLDHESTRGVVHVVELTEHHRSSCSSGVPREEAVSTTGREVYRRGGGVDQAVGRIARGSWPRPYRCLTVYTANVALEPARGALGRVHRKDRPGRVESPSILGQSSLCTEARLAASDGVTVVEARYARCPRWMEM